MLDPEINNRIAAVRNGLTGCRPPFPKSLDSRDEPDYIFDLYGPEARKPGTFAANCLLARKLAENDVRFVQLYHQGWDQHGNLPNDISNQCQDVDQASAALITDLKQRGLLDETLVIWGGEFGRTNYSQGKLTERQLRPRPPPALLHHLDGRRGHQNRHRTAKPTNSAITSPKTRCTCTIFRPPSCTCWGSTTRN